MTTPPAPRLRVLPTVLFCLTLTGVADEAASAGAVVGWGLDTNGQATPPNDVNGVSGAATGIAADGSHSCAIQAGTGDVVCWGFDFFGQATPPDAVNGVSGTATDIATGGEHSLAIEAPEPGVILQLGAGAAGLAFLDKRRMRKNRRAKPVS